MKRLFFIFVPAIILASCGEGPKKDKAAELVDLKKQKSDIEAKIKTLEAGKKDSGRVTPVMITTVQPAKFTAYVEVQSSIGGDEVVTATAQSPGIVNKVIAQVGQKVRKGQVLATLDVSLADQQIKGLEPQIELQKALYEKQQKLWAQNIGTEVQLLSVKAQYESLLKQKASMQTQRSLYSIVSPIDGTIDAATVKVGDQEGGVLSTGFRIINLDKLKAEANLGENYIGRVKQGDPVTLVFPGGDDSIQTKLTYVAQSVDPSSRAFLVQVKLGSNKKLHPNMSCIMKIANYSNASAITVPVSVIQKTSKGEVVFTLSDGKAKAALVTTGKNSNGQVEVLTGLNAGDKVITTGFEDLNDGDPVAAQQ